MDVRFSSEKHQGRWAFDLPDIPYTVITQVLIFEESHVEMIHAGLFDEFQGLAPFFSNIGTITANR